MGVELLVELDESENASVFWLLVGSDSTAMEASTVGAVGSSPACWAVVAGLVGTKDKFWRYPTA